MEEITDKTRNLKKAASDEGEATENKIVQDIGEKDSTIKDMTKNDILKEGVEEGEIAGN